MSLQTCAVCPARAGHLQQTAARELEGVVGRGREAASRIRTVHQVHLGDDGSQGLSLYPGLLCGRANCPWGGPNCCSCAR